VRCDPCGAMRWTMYGRSQVECSILAISKRGFVSPICCSLINTFFWWNICIYRASQQFMWFPFWHFLSSFRVSSFVPYLCLLFEMCAAYAEVGLFDLIYLMCSLNLTPIAPPDCPTYALLHVLHFSFIYYWIEEFTVKHWNLYMQTFRNTPCSIFIGR